MLVGLLLAPAVPALCVWFLSAVPTGILFSSPPPHPVLALLFGYPISYALGLPTLVVLRLKGWKAWWHYALGGALGGAAIPAATIAIGLFNTEHETELSATYVTFSQALLAVGYVPLYGACFGVLSATTFWLIAMSRWVRFSGKSSSRQSAA